MRCSVQAAAMPRVLVYGEDLPLCTSFLPRQIFLLVQRLSCVFIRVADTERREPLYQGELCQADEIGNHP